MATLDLVIDNDAEPTQELSGSGTFLASGVFDGAHIRLEASDVELGDYIPFIEILEPSALNLTFDGPVWIRAVIVSLQDATLINAKITTP
jgi:hypothetical protein